MSIGFTYTDEECARRRERYLRKDGTVPSREEVRERRHRRVSYISRPDGLYLVKSGIAIRVLQDEELLNLA